jgi:sigma-E factor negative regulatory protein RseB
MSTRFNLSLALLALLVTHSLSAFASNEVARQWLERMIDAVNNLDYQGTFIYLHDNQLETMLIEHRVKNGRSWERLSSLNGEPREVIRDQDSITCVLPGAQENSVDKRALGKQFFALLPEDLGKLDTYYGFSVLGKGRVAGRNTIVVAIVPRDGYRYGYRFFLDEESALPLKSDLMSEKGKAVEQTMFTQVAIGLAEMGDSTHEPAALAETIVLKSVRNQPKITQNPSEHLWSFQDLPNGFRLSMRNQLPDLNGAQMVEQYVLTDGLASLSVFVETAGRGEALKGVSRLGAINAWGGEVQGYQVTAVGEVPAVTLFGVVDAMRLKH